MRGGPQGLGAKADEPAFRQAKPEAAITQARGA